MTGTSKKHNSLTSDSSSSSSDHAGDPSYILRRYENNKSTRKMLTPRTRRAKRKRNSSNIRRGSKTSEDNNGIEDMKATILSWIIVSQKIQEKMRVHHVNGIKNGIINREGILCMCCDRSFSVREFDAHCGSKIIRPYDNILISESGLPLLSSMAEAWNESDELERHKFNGIETKSGASDAHDDACMICADGGDLICCDKCNSTYHQRCMHVKVVPNDSWCCPYCVCKFCGDHCLENDYLLSCSQCEKQYHWECYQEREPLVIDINSTPSLPLCGRGCREVYEKLEKMVGAENELEEGFKWTLLRRMDPEFGVCVSDLNHRLECHSKLALAWRVMDECFETIIDRHTRINVIQSVVYNCGSNFNRINFRGFYTAILEKDNEIVSAASLRIHGNKLAEMPFIATREMYRGQGMCRKLMTAIESALCYIKVENLVIPSVTEKIGNWIGRYGFQKIEPTMKNEILGHNTLMFHDSVRLQKVLLSIHSAQSNRALRAMKKELKNNEDQSGDTSMKRVCFDLNLEP